MSVQPGPTVVYAAATAGFDGDALATIVAIGHRESGWDDTAQGDLTIEDGTWGCSAGVWQIRTLHAAAGTGGDRDLQALIPGATDGQPGSGRGDLARQAAAAWSISSGGTNFGAWTTAVGLPAADRQAAADAIGTAKTTSPLANVPGGSSGGLLGDATGALASAIDRGLGAVIGYNGTFSEWAAMVLLRTAEVVGGALLMAAGGLVFLDVIFAGRTHQSARSAGLVARSVRQGVRLARSAATVAAA